MSIAIETLLTAEEYGRLPELDYPNELVRGRIVKLNMPYPIHGYFCTRFVEFLAPYVRVNDLGRVMCNDSGVITERGPDTVRGADVCYYSFARLPKGPLPKSYVNVVPELVVEVRSSFDRWSEIITKVGEYLTAGVNVVVVIDPDSATMYVYRPDQPEQFFSNSDELTLPDLFGDGFRVSVKKFFE